MRTSEEILAEYRLIFVPLRISVVEVFTWSRCATGSHLGKANRRVTVPELEQLPPATSTAMISKLLPPGVRCLTTGRARLDEKQIRLQWTLRTGTTVRLLSTRASRILSSLDIPTTSTEVPGVYDGEWKGSGEILTSVCPTTGEELARVKSVSIMPR